MEDLKERLGENKYILFNNLQNYLGTELLFSGSIKRYDYLKNYSDVDVIVITDNVKSILFKSQQFLHTNKIHQIIQQYEVGKRVIYGHKLKYENAEEDISFDLIVFDEKYRKEVVQHMHDSSNFPWFILIMLYLLKNLYYRFNLISRITFVNLKDKIFSNYFNKPKCVMMNNFL